MSNVETAVAAGYDAAKAIGGLRVRKFVIPAPEKDARFLTSFSRGTCMSGRGGDPDLVC